MSLTLEEARVMVSHLSNDDVETLLITLVYEMSGRLAVTPVKMAEGLLRAITLADLTEQVLEGMFGSTGEEKDVD